MKMTIIYSDHEFHALYQDNTLSFSGDSDYINPDSMALAFARTHTEYEVYEMSDEVYEVLLDGEDYPESLSDVPLDQLENQTSRFTSMYAV